MEFGFAILGTLDCPVGTGLSGAPCNSGASQPRGSASAPEKPESSEFTKLIFNRHTGLSGVHWTTTIHCPVHCQSNG
jgi:hypothetical protein